MFDLMRNDYLNTYNPFREMEDFERRAFGGFFGGRELAEFRTDLTDEGDHYLLEADLPGFEKKDIQLEIQGDTLTIRAQRHSKAEDQDQKSKMLCTERSYGSYSRRFDLTGVDAEKISAKYENGVLKLTLPKAAATGPEIRKLEIA